MSLRDPRGDDNAKTGVMALSNQIKVQGPINPNQRKKSCSVQAENQKRFQGVKLTTITLNGKGREREKSLDAPIKSPPKIIKAS